MRPDLTGCGLGKDFLRAITGLARELALFDLRAAVAVWNVRAIRAATAAGFREGGAFRASSGTAFTVLVSHAVPTPQDAPA